MLMLWSVLWFYSSILTVRPEAILIAWEQDKKKVDPDLAKKMLARLNTSILINPLDANSHLLMAKYYEVLANAEPSTYNKLAIQKYQDALEHQPTWGYAWGKLANFYSGQHALNERQLVQALSKAMWLEPFENNNQAVIIPLIFKHWLLIANDEQEKAQATKIIKHALKYGTYGHLTLNSAKKYHQLTTLAPMLTREWHINRLKKYLRETEHD